MKLARLFATPRSAALAIAGAALAVLTASPPARAELTEFHVDPYHSQAMVLVDHYGIARLGGMFGKLDGIVQVDPAGWSGWSFDLTIPVFEFYSTHPPRTDAVIGPQLLDAKTYPQIKFKGDDVSKTGDQWVVSGALTIRDVTKNVSIPLTVRGPRSDPFGASRIGIEGEVTVKRSEFGMPFDRKMPDGSPVLGDDVTIQLQIEGVKAGGLIKKPE